MSFLFAYAPYALALVAVVGALTAFFAATIGITQFDIKKVLAYSTVSQLGYMFLAVGSGSFFAGVFHLMTHAFFKALLFLGSGSVIHGMHHEQDIRKMGGLKEFMPITRWTFLIGCIAIAGVPMFSGFFSKDEILFYALYNEHVLGGPTTSAVWGWMLWTLGVATAGMTAFYMFRLYFLTFEGECRADEHTKAHIHESPWQMTVPLIVLAFLSVVGGYLGVTYLLGGPWLGLDLHGWLHQVIGHGEALFTKRFDGYGVAYATMGVAVAIAAGGIYLAYALYGKPSEVPGQVRERLGLVYDAVYNKYYVDEFYEATLGRGLRAFGHLCHRFFDDFVIDTVLVGGSAWLMRLVGSVLRQLQNGDVQRYAAWVVFGAGILFYLIAF
jgi:NADH-quinone oxidoreductase subunit L